MSRGNGEGRTVAAGVRDFAVLGMQAVVSGIAVALALGLAALVLSHEANAATPNDAKAGMLLLATGTDGKYEPAPTLETEVAIRVSGIVARTRVTQSFHNPGSDSVEGIYVFPLPEKGAVDHLTLNVGTRVIEGEIQEKQAARKTYEMAKSEGRKAALLEQQRPNLFTSAVAHIGPNEVVRVTIEYQQSIAPDNGVYRLRFPLAVTPRYVPSGPPVEQMPDLPKAHAAAWISDSAAASAEADLLQPAFMKGDGSALVNPVDIAVSLDAGTPLAQVKSTYHEARVEKQDGGRVMVYLAKDQEEADHDFELVWSLDPGAAPRAALFTETVGSSDYGLIMVVPPETDAAAKLAQASVPRETILIVDTSGSMQGTSLTQAKAALGEALASLKPADRFNIVEFNSVTRPMWPDALPATAGNVQNALAWVAKLRADGGTEMAPALLFALDGKGAPGYLRQVVFMTDGGVSNEDELFALISRHLGASRLFTVGIGSAPNSHFMTKAAQFGRGSFTYVSEVHEVHEKMGGLLARIAAPVLQDVSITTSDGRPVTTYPERVPDLYAGEPIVVTTTAASLTGTIVVSGTSGTVPWSVALTPATAPKASGVGALWARAKIASLMDAMRTGGDSDALRAQAVQVALAHHLVSAYTSLVAVDVTPTATGSAKTMMVPAALPRGYIGGDGSIPQTDTPAELQMLMGLMALLAAATVAMIGRRAPARVV